MIKNLNDVEITKDFVAHVVAFSMAESGAMGNPGRIIFFSDTQEIYEMNYFYEGKVKEIFKVFSIFHQCTNHLLGKGNEIPKGWKYTYLGAGNHLFMMEWLDLLFYKIMDKGIAESEIYLGWINIVKQILIQLDSKANFQKIRNEQRTNLKIVPFNAKRKDIGGNSIRDFLSVKWESGASNKERIVAIGINPSTAQDGESDTTMTKLCRFLDMYGFNNVTMLNLYESVSSDQNKINKSTKTNFNQKREVFDNADIILLAWGVTGYAKEKREAMSVLAEYAEKLYCIKNPKGKFPVHPSRMPYQSVIMPIISSPDFMGCGMYEYRDSKRKEANDCEHVMTECDVNVFLNDEIIMSLGAGISAVYKFSKLVDQGIEGAAEIVRSFNCNRDVYIAGDMLLQFIEKEYPEYITAACERIKGNDRIYKVVCYDMS